MNTNRIGIMLAVLALGTLLPLPTAQGLNTNECTQEAVDTARAAIIAAEQAVDEFVGGGLVDIDLPSDQLLTSASFLPAGCIGPVECESIEGTADLLAFNQGSICHPEVEQCPTGQTGTYVNGIGHCQGTTVRDPCTVIDCSIEEPEVPEVPDLEGEDAGGIALACVGSLCPGTGCADTDSDCEGKKCHWWQTWGVEGDHSGSGSVRFWVECGSGIPAVCETVNLPHCEDGPGDGGGKLGCFYEILHGNPRDIIGKCIDPVNPRIVYEAIPAGLPYDAAAHQLEV